MMDRVFHPKQVIRGLGVLTLSCMVSACTGLTPPSPGGMRSVNDGCGTTALNPADNTRLSSIEQALAENKPYAALAQLDALGSNAVQARIIKADALRRIDQSTQAQAIYESLLGGCMAGRAHHGLGLIAAQGGQHALSLEHLQRAREARPTDVRIRNDLGYSYLLSGNWTAAQFEFLTVLDLNANDALATRNLVLLQFRQNLTDKGIELANRLGLDKVTVDRLRQQAEAMSAPIPPIAPPSPPTPQSGPSTS